MLHSIDSYLANKATSRAAVQRRYRRSFSYVPFSLLAILGIVFGLSWISWSERSGRLQVCTENLTGGTISNVAIPATNIGLDLDVAPKTSGGNVKVTALSFEQSGLVFDTRTLDASIEDSNYFSRQKGSSQGNIHSGCKPASIAAVTAPSVESHSLGILGDTDLDEPFNRPTPYSGLAMGTSSSLNGLPDVVYDINEAAVVGGVGGEPNINSGGAGHEVVFIIIHHGIEADAANVTKRSSDLIELDDS